MKAKMNSSGIKLKETCANHAHNLFQVVPNAKHKTMSQKVASTRKLKVVKTLDMSFVKPVEKVWYKYGRMENTFLRDVTRSSEVA